MNWGGGGEFWVPPCPLVLDIMVAGGAILHVVCYMLIDLAYKLLVRFHCSDMLTIGVVCLCVCILYN